MFMRLSHGQQHIKLRARQQGRFVHLIDGKHKFDNKYVKQ
jgi:hypothetical protein